MKVVYLTFCTFYAHKEHLSKSHLFNVLCFRKSLIRLYMFFVLFIFFFLFMLFMLVKFSHKKKKSKIGPDNLNYHTTYNHHNIFPLLQYFSIITVLFNNHNPFPLSQYFSIITVFFNNHNTLQLSQAACMTSGNIIAVPL